MKTIVAAIDFSDISDEIVERARILADQFSAHLWILHVAASDPDFVGYSVGPQHVRDGRAETLKNERREMQKTVDFLQKEGIKASALLAQGPCPETILKELTELDADLLVIGSHGHGGLYDLLLGSVAKFILKRATCPVLVIPRKSF